MSSLGEHRRGRLGDAARRAELDEPNLGALGELGELAALGPGELARLGVDDAQRPERPPLPRIGAPRYDRIPKRSTSAWGTRSSVFDPPGAWMGLGPSSMQLYTRNIQPQRAQQALADAHAAPASAAVVTRQGVTLDLPEEKAAHLVPELSFSRVGARLKIHF